MFGSPLKQTSSCKQFSEELLLLLLLARYENDKKKRKEEKMAMKIFIFLLLGIAGTIATLPIPMYISHLA